MQRQMTRHFALIFALVAAATSIVFVRSTFAAADYTPHGITTAYCAKSSSNVQASYQDSYFGSELHGFWQGEHITVSFEFPDGRLFTATASELLDGVVDMPPNYTTFYYAD